MLRRRPSAKVVVVPSGGDAVAFAAVKSSSTATATESAAAATAAVRVRQAPAVQVAREPAPGRRTGRTRDGGRTPRRVREELSLRESQTQDEGAGQREQARVEAPVDGEPPVGPRRR